MKIWNNIAYYLNYFNFMRGNSKIVKYFEQEPNKTIKELTEEGYLHFYKEFLNIINSYSKSTTLNKEENKFINEIFANCIINSNKINIPINEYKLNFKMIIINLDKEINIKFLESEIIILKDTIKKLNIISDSIILRKFIKKLLEIFIAKNINDIKIENYSPDKKILEKYDSSLNKNYVYRKGTNENIQKSIKDLIQKANNEYDETNKKQKLVSSDEKINKIIKILLKVKNECNKIINLNENTMIIEEFIYNEIKLDEEGDIKENQKQNEIKINNNINESVKKKNYIKISKIIDFIINGNSQNQSLNRVKDLKKKFNDIMKKIKYDIENFTNYKMEIKCLEKELKNKLINLPLKDFELKLSDDQLEYISENLIKNPLNIEELEIKNGYEGIENDIMYINKQRESMDIKNKFKLNVTFYNNVKLIYIKKKVDELIKLIEIEEIDKQIEIINKYFNEKSYNLINKIMNRSELIGEEKQIFIDIFENQFKDESIDINNGEINNFYFYTYLLKNNLYDETSYKNSEYLNEDYI